MLLRRGFEKVYIIIRNLSPMDHLAILKQFKAEKDANSLRRNADKVILLRKKQISLNNPAVAELWITFPTGHAPANFESFFLSQKNRYLVDATEHSFKQEDEYTFMIRIASAFNMYSWLEDFIRAFADTYTFMGFKIEQTGTWR